MFTIREAETATDIAQVRETLAHRHARRAPRPGRAHPHRELGAADGRGHHRVGALPKPPPVVVELSGAVLVSSPRTALNPADS